MQKSDKNVQKLANKLLERGNNRICNYGIITDKGEYDLNWEICHVAMNNPHERGARNLSNGEKLDVREIPILGVNTINNKFSPNADEKEMITFFEWLFNYSPWASTFVTKDINKAWEDKYFISDLDTPANLMIGGMIASRWTTENTDRLKTWYYLVDQGIDPNIAFLLSLNFSWSGENVLVKYRIGHTPVVDILDKNCNKAFVENNPTNLLDKYSRLKCYKNINTTFDKKNVEGGTPQYLRVENTLKKWMREIDNPESVKDLNPFSKSNQINTGNTFKKETLLEFAKTTYGKEYVYGT